MTISNDSLNFSNIMTDHWPIDNHPNINSQVQDFCANIACEIFVKHIFPYLNLHELSVIRRVNKQWEEFASESILWQSGVYQEIAFSSKNWAEWDADLVKNVDLKQEILSLPKNIAEELRYSAFPGKSIRETHVLVRMPKELTIKKLGELAKKYFPNNNIGYKRPWEGVIHELGDKSVGKSFWMLMTKDILFESRNKSYNHQKNMVNELAKTAEVSYQVPTILEAATCILAEYSRCKNYLFSDNPLTYTRCQENIQDYHMAVGGFDFLGLSIIDNYFDKLFMGIAAVRKF